MAAAIPKKPQAPKAKVQGNAIDRVCEEIRLLTHEAQKEKDGGGNYHNILAERDTFIESLKNLLY